MIEVGKLWPFALKAKPVNLKEKAEVRDDDDSLGSLFDDEGDDLTIEQVREMLGRDAQVKAAMNLKIMARASTGWTIDAASDSTLDKEVRDYVVAQFDQMKGTMDFFLRGAMSALPYGVSIHEVVYRMIEEGPWRGKIGIDAIKRKKPERFKIKTDKFGNISGLVLTKSNNQEKKLDPAYFVVWANEHEGDYVGHSDLKASWRWYKIKDFLGRKWNIYMEKHATPVPVGKYPPNTTPKDRERITKFLQSINSLKAAVVPQGWELELLESGRSGADFETAIAYCDRMIVRGLLVPNLLMDEGKSGSYSLGAVHIDAFHWVLNSLGKELEETVIGEQVIRRMVDLNYTVESYPKFKFQPFVDVNFKEIAEGMATLVGAEIIQPDDETARDRLGFSPVKQIAAGGVDVEAGSGKGQPTPNQPPIVDPPAASEEKKKQSGFSEFANQPKLDQLRHAGKMDFVAIDTALVNIEEQAKGEIALAVQSMHQGIKKAVRKKEIIQGRRLDLVDKLQLPNLGQVRDALITAFGDALHQGVLDAFNEVNHGLASVGQPKIKMPKKDAGNKLVDFADDRWAASRAVADSWASKVVVQREMLLEYSRQAFTISGVMRDDLLNKAKLTISRGIIRGATYKQVQAELDNLFLPYYMDTVDPSVGSSARLHNIVRTNVAEAYNSGIMNLCRHPDVAGFVRGYEYGAVLDDRTTEFCNEHNGMIVREGSNELSGIIPPNHYQCRSVMIPIVAGEDLRPGSWDGDVWRDNKFPGSVPADGFGV